MFNIGDKVDEIVNKFTQGEILEIVLNVFGNPEYVVKWPSDIVSVHRHNNLTFSKQIHAKPEAKELKCECGAHAVKSQIHSQWCCLSNSQ